MQLETSETQRERLEFVIERYDSQPLGTVIVGILFLLLGSSWLLGRPEFVRHYHGILLVPPIMLGLLVLPKLLRRFYYEPKFGYVKPRTPEISNRQFWVVGIAGTIFFIYLMPFVILPGLEPSAWRLEPLSFFLGILLVLVCVPQLVRATNSFAWRFLPFGFLLTALGLLPMFHLQTKEQVSNGWLWVAMGVESCIFGALDHIFLLRKLSRRSGESLDG